MANAPSLSHAQAPPLGHRAAMRVPPAPLRHQSAKSLPTTKKLHAFLTTAGLLSNHFLSLLTASYGLCGHAQYACKLFDEMPKPKRTTIAYKAIIRMHTESGYRRRALQVFVEMHDSGRCSADEYTYPFVIRACKDLVLLEFGMVVHGLTVKSGVVSVSFVGNSLLAMYINCGDRAGGRTLFDLMEEERTVVSWNTMISGFFRTGTAKEALMLFWRMVDEKVEVDSATIRGGARKISRQGLRFLNFQYRYNNLKFQPVGGGFSMNNH